MNTAVKQLLKLAENCSDQEYLDAVRIRVAEIDGWTFKEVFCNDLYGYRPGEHAGNARAIHHIHFYNIDLNAVASVEESLTHEQAEEYGRTLRGMVSEHFVPTGFDCYALATATAMQRCEAIILTLGGVN